MKIKHIIYAVFLIFFFSVGIWISYRNYGYLLSPNDIKIYLRPDTQESRKCLGIIENFPFNCSINCSDYGNQVESLKSFFPPYSDPNIRYKVTIDAICWRYNLIEEKLDYNITYFNISQWENRGESFLLEDKNSERNQIKEYYFNLTNWMVFSYQSPESERNQPWMWKYWDVNYSWIFEMNITFSSICGPKCGVSTRIAAVWRCDWNSKITHAYILQGNIEL